jgi:hypothetical protein
LIKKILKITGKSVLVLLAVIILFLLVLVIFHKISLNAERDKIIPNGLMVEVNGHSIHVYTEGNNENAPALVFLAGSGTAAPVYDFKPLYMVFA